MRSALTNRLLALAISGSSLLSSVESSPLTHGRLSVHEVRDLASEGSEIVRRQDAANAPLAVTGVAQNDVQPRLEIRELAKNEIQWNLFLLGMQRLQETDQNDPTSWYALSGIHGMPHVAWNGVESEGYAQSGYCMHSSNLFCTWHRPYIALWEQVLHAIMLELANEWTGPERDNFTDAANKWRFPFWDYAALPPEGETNVPDFMTQPQIDVKMPNGTKTIDNPLYSYKFSPQDLSSLNSQNDPQFSVYTETKRYPTDLTVNARSQENGVVNNMNNLRPQIRDALYDLFTNYDNFTLFNSQASHHPGQYQSLETVHGWVHNYVGGDNGHMLAVPFSAFDPAFMLHHANIDRCFAIWQALHPDSYVEAEVQDYSTFMINAGQVLGPDDALYPFRSNQNGDFWTSNSVRDIKIFSYTYPELQDIPDQATLRATINRLYGQSTVSRHTKRTDISDIGEVIDGVINGVTETIEKLVQPGQIDADAAKKDQRRYEYTANIKIDKCALSGSGSIYLFIGDFEDEPAKWRTDEHLAGASPLFVMDNSAVANGGSKDIYAAVSLTRELEQRVASGDLGCMSPSEVIPYLSENLSWRIAKPDGSAIPADQVAGLEISIVKAEYRPAASDCEFPERVGGYEMLSQITCGKAGGLASVGNLLGLKGSHH
ncbi:Tyrosinase [Macrophomina phaseolina MS6]|uniref:tyrosinase n=2 Tax=Macrophomina phaseolina TaxID=35725 RepID=K2RF87_MACPH|nr:Tyrosinase [Macrophomina phaseolina MS6]KAH7058728.1 common central domain of tyrosinase-domain-containing protein [Macrophomina phaseolina]